ncbi:helix-turn-helix domain-containing protein [Alicyclobacillus fastidiosus]|uniref:Helix-turn-helix domain-containing protein n=1 Tax=Alicyclobacillus fastidiosus TaxID=392011 RepID=A0ABV5ALC1_9BACL|nr:helix-turn-helix domain-containing protein [Alicyclobacillus fastidiosus]WEH08244.1 helix-turn-helix domain-containing protein [Alicyclobacillus fastidiosus]
MKHIYSNMLSIHEVASILQVPVVTAYDMAQKCIFPSIQLDRRILVSKYELSVWLLGYQRKGELIDGQQNAPRIAQGPSYVQSPRSFT